MKINNIIILLIILDMFRYIPGFRTLKEVLSKVSTKMIVKYKY